MVQGPAPEHTVALIERHLRQRPAPFTLTEAASTTGLAVHEARDALDALLAKYVCRLQVSEHGDLIYNFSAPLRRRGAKTWAERRREILTWLWRVFTVLYRVWIAVMLVVYFVIFLVLMIWLVAQAGGRGRGRSSSGSGFSGTTGRSALDPTADDPPITLGLGSSPASVPSPGPLQHPRVLQFLGMFTSIFHWRTITGATVHARDRQGYRYKHYQPQPGILNRTKKSFVAAVYDFVFGPPRVVQPSLQNEREVAAYLRRHKGIVTTTELSALAGWTFPPAETFLIDCVIRFEGDTRVSDEAALYGQFDTIIRGVGSGDAGKIVHYWDEYEPEYELTGNSAAHNGLIVGMNSFNLLFSLFVLTGSLQQIVQAQVDAQLATSLAGGAVAAVLLGWIPLIFSFLFFLIPASRRLGFRSLRRRRHQQNIRKRLFKAIFAHQGAPRTLSQIATAVNANAPEEVLAAALVEERMKELVLDLSGDMAITATAEIQFSFPRISREMHAGPRLRRQRQVDGDLGDIVVESDNA